MTNSETKKWGILDATLVRYEQAMAWATRHEKAVLLGAFVLAFLIRVLYLVLLGVLDSPPTYDGNLYHQWVRQILDGQSYTYNGYPTAVRTPGYQLILAVVYYFFGFSSAVGRLLQTSISALTCIVVYFLGRELFDEHVGLWALLGMVFYPVFIYMVGEFYPDTLALLPAYLALLVAARMVSDSKWQLPLLLGLLLGATIMLRPTASLLLPLFGVWPFIYFHLRRALRNAVLVGVGWLLVFSPWIVRNYLVFDEFIPLTSFGSPWSGANPLAPLAKGRSVHMSVWAGGNPDSGEILRQLSEMHGGVPIRELFGSDPPQRGVEGIRGLWGWPGLTETENRARFTQLAVAWIRQNPGAYLGLIPWKLLRAWSPASFGMAFSREQPPGLLVLVTPPYIAFLLVALYGLIRFRRHWRRLFLLYSPLIAVSLTSVIFYGGTRHALIMHPALVLLAATGLDGLLGHWVRRWDVRSLEVSSSEVPV